MGHNDDAAAMRRAIEVAALARVDAHPRPWVGAVVEPGGYVGATGPDADGGLHAETAALAAAAASSRGATLYTTLEPCVPGEGKRTRGCVPTIIEAGIRRVVVGTVDPDRRVSGAGIAALQVAGIDVTVGVEESAVRRQLDPYLKHRATGRPWVVLKLAATVDGRTAAADGTSRWITGPDARADVHRLRAESDAVLVGAGTVRADDPALTVRDAVGRDPRRVVLGKAPRGAAVHPCTELAGKLPAVLDRLGADDVVQLLVEGGPTVAHAFHQEGLVDQYVIYLAPALAGGDDGAPLLAGPGAATIADVWRGRITDVAQLGGDLRITMEPR